MTNEDKLEEDFNRFSLEIEQEKEKQMKRLRKEINSLKEKACKMSEELLSASSNEEKRS